MHGHVPSCSVCCPCLCAARLLLKCMHAVHCTCPAASCKMETALDTYLSGSQHARPNKRVKPCARTHHSLHAFPSSSSRRSRDAYERSTSRASRRSPQQVSKSGRVDESQIQRRLETGTGCRVTANVAPLKRQINKPHSLFTKSVCPMHTRRPSKTSARPTSLLHPRCASSVAGLRARRCAALLAGGTAVHQLLAFAVQPAAALLRRCANLDSSPAAQLQQVTNAQMACAEGCRAYER